MTDAPKAPRRYLMPLPRTPSILAYGVLIGCFLSGPAMDWKTAMLMILTYYFTKEQQREAGK